jgi:hypothetical protein
MNATPETLLSIFDRLALSPRTPPLATMLDLGFQLESNRLRGLPDEAIPGAGWKSATRELLNTVMRYHRIAASRKSDAEHAQRLLDEIEQANGWPFVRDELAKFLHAVNVELEKRSPPPPKPLKVGRLELCGRAIHLDGQPVPLNMTAEAEVETLRFLRALMQNGHSWTSGSSIGTGFRWDRLKKKLPAKLRTLIEGKSGTGYRLLPKAWRNKSVIAP